MWALVLSAGLLAQLDPGTLEAAPAPAAVVAPAEQPAAAAPKAPAALKLAAGATLEVELVDGLSSETSKVGDRFALRLAEPLTQDGVVIVAAGAAGEGEVIDAARKGMGGKQGKLIIAARFVDLNGRRTRIRGMTLQAAGKSRVDLTTGLLLVPYVGVASVLVEGGDIVIPSGTRATVKLAEAIELTSTAPTNSLGENEK